jgi:HK97 family phage major capsid protein
VTARYVPELTEATDASPTLVQPTITTAQGRAFVPISIELTQDWGSIEQQLAQLIVDARNVLDSSKFLTGSGTNEPKGILTTLTTSQRVQTAGTAALAVGDPWLLKAALPARFISNTTFLANPATWDKVYRFVAQGSTTEPRQFSDGDRGGDFLGRPKAEYSSMATALTSGTKLMIAGDVRTAYTVVDRLGMNVELISHLFGPTNRYPIGARGLYCYWRTGADVVASNALRYLETL